MYFDRCENQHILLILCPIKSGTFCLKSAVFLSWHLEKEGLIWRHTGHEKTSQWWQQRLLKHINVTLYMLYKHLRSAAKPKLYLVQLVSRQVLILWRLRRGSAWLALESQEALGENSLCPVPLGSPGYHPGNETQRPTPRLRSKAKQALEEKSRGDQSSSASTCKL